MPRLKVVLYGYFFLLLCGIFAFVSCKPGSGSKLDQDDPTELKYYREQNSRLAQPAEGERRVVFMGDSITESWNLAEYFPGKPFINRGIHAQTTSQILLRFQADVVDLKPRVVVILGGTNDIGGNAGPMTLEAIEANLASMADLARASGITVILATLLPVRDIGRVINTQQRPPARISALNEWIRKYCTENEIVCLDYFAATVDEKGVLKEDLTADGLHPNAKGYEIMKGLAGPAIDRALNGQ